MTDSIFTTRQISHDEADEIAGRLINSHFHREPHARVGIPARPDYDDDLLIRAYIKQQRSAAPAPDKAEPSREAQIVQWLRRDREHRNWELTYVYEEEGDSYWAVHERRGSVNDREWNLIGQGDTPLGALDAAIRHYESSCVSAAPAPDKAEPAPPASWPPELVADPLKVRSNLLFWQDRCLNAPANLLQTFVVEGAGARHLSTDLLEAAILIDKLLHSAPPASDVRLSPVERRTLAWIGNAGTMVLPTKASAAAAERLIAFGYVTRFEGKYSLTDAGRSLAGKSGGGDA